MNSHEQKKNLDKVTGRLQHQSHIFNKVNFLLTNLNIVILKLIKHVKVFIFYQILQNK